MRRLVIGLAKALLLSGAVVLLSDLFGWPLPRDADGGSVVARASGPLDARALQNIDPAEAIAGLERTLAAAWVTRDRGFIESLLAPDWTVTDPSGRVLTRRQVLDEAFLTSERTISAMSIDDVRVRLLGDAAVATGRTRATGSYRGESASVVLRFTDVFARLDGRWRIVTSHSSRVAP